MKKKKSPSKKPSFDPITNTSSGVLMKLSIGTAFALILIFVSLLVSGCTKVPAGQVGVKVYLLGDNKGVSKQEILTPGRYWIGVNEELHLFPTFQQNYNWSSSPHEGANYDESFHFQTNDGSTIGCDIGIAYQFRQEKISDIFQKYRMGAEEITHTVLHNYVRDAMNNNGTHYSVNQIYGESKNKFMLDVQKMVEEEVEPQGIEITKISLTSDFRLPDAVKNALNSKNQAVQKAQQAENEVAEAKAEAEKVVAKAEGEAKSILVRATAQSKANVILSRSLTRELIENKKIEKWDGHYPEFVAGSGANSIMINTDGLRNRRPEAPKSDGKTEEPKDE